MKYVLLTPYAIEKAQIMSESVAKESLYKAELLKNITAKNGKKVILFKEVEIFSVIIF